MSIFKINPGLELVLLDLIHNLLQILVNSTLSTESQNQLPGGRPQLTALTRVGQQLQAPSPDYMLAHPKAAVVSLVHHMASTTHTSKLQILLSARTDVK